MCSVDVDETNAYNDSLASIAGTHMTALNIRQLDPTVKEQLRLRAARNGRSMEAEARAILKEALAST